MHFACMNSFGTDQRTFLHRLISAFVVCCQSIIPLVCTMQSDELAHLSKVYSVIAGAFIPIFHFILNNSA